MYKVLKCPFVDCGMDKFGFTHIKTLGILKTGNVLIMPSSDAKHMNNLNLEIEIKCPTCGRKTSIIMK